MRMMTSDSFDRWIRGAGLVALVALVWAVVVPDGIFWSAILAAGLMGAAVATTLLVRSRQAPTLAQVIASARLRRRRSWCGVPPDTRTQPGFAR